MPRVTVAVEPPYEVVIDHNALPDLQKLVVDRRQVHVVTQEPVLEACGARLRSSLGDHALSVMPDGESAKTLETVDGLCRDFAQAGLLRDDVVIAFGGGVVGDTAGLAAAVYHRGVAVVQAPTTLLAQVDAAIGGKTAVNLPEGKNLVGAFHQPIGVVADTSTLTTLPDREYRCGLGEVAKYALMPQGEAVSVILQRSLDGVRSRDAKVLVDLVAACAAIKADVVAADPEERSGLRATLNYGHTLAHALETAAAHELAHGEAVAIGLVFAATLASALERVTADVPDRVRNVVEELGLPTQVPADLAGAKDLVGLMRRDKKAKGGVTFVLPGPNGLEPVHDPPERALSVALRAVGVEA